MALLWLVASWHVDKRIDRELLLLGVNRMLVIGSAARVDRIPDRKWNAEEALAADAPVVIEPANPVRIASFHVRRVPDDLLALGKELLLVLEEADKPLPCGDVL